MRGTIVSHDAHKDAMENSCVPSLSLVATFCALPDKFIIGSERDTNAEIIHKLKLRSVRRIKFPASGSDNNVIRNL